MNKPLSVIGIDYGLKNLALTHFYVHTPGNVSIKRSFMFPEHCIVSNLTDKERKGKKRGKRVVRIVGAKSSFSTQMSNYSKLLDSIIKEGIDVIGVERFMVRGRMGQAQCECISVMIGILAEKCRKKKIDLRLIGASDWKNKLNRDSKVSLEKLYDYTNKKFNMPPHILDSFFQGCYGAGLDYKKMTHKKILSLLAFVHNRSKEIKL